MSDTPATSPAEAGLTALEARRRLRQFGPNRVADRGEVPLWKLALAQFRSLVVWLLLAAAGIAWALAERAEAIAILAALSPVSVDSFTCRAVACSSRPSAGTAAPASRMSTSPGTRSAAGTRLM